MRSADVDHCLAAVTGSMAYCFTPLRLQGWFDDRVEARNALSKLKGLRESMVDMDYHDLPWIEKDEREMRLFNPKAEAMRR